MSPIDITKEHNLVIISRSPRIHRIQSRDWYRQRFFTEHWFRMKRAKIRAQEAFQRIKRKKRNATPSFPPPPPLPFIPHISSLFLPFLEKKPALWRAPEDNRGPRTIVGANQSRIEFRPSSFPRWFHTRGRETREKGDGSRLEIRGSARREAEKRKGWGWRRRRRSSPRATDLKSGLSGHEWRASLAISSFDRSPGRDHGLTINDLKGGNCDATVTVNKRGRIAWNV